MTPVIRSFLFNAVLMWHTASVINWLLLDTLHHRRHILGRRHKV